MDFDVIVIGGGHAGCEAAHAAAQMGCRTAMITLNPERIGFMSCNPAIGGLAKGQLVKEIDALGGVMGRITDRAAIQYRRLNASKGPAVRSSRAQCDKDRYATEMQAYLRTVKNLTIVGAEATGLLMEGPRVVGIRLSDGSTMRSRSVVVTSGTFLQAVMFTGFEREEGGRAGDASAKGLSGVLSQMGFRLRRLKTGTPPRLHRKSIDWSKAEPQPGDEVPIPFSFYWRPNPFPFLPQVACHITYTNERTHEVIERNFDQSPMFTGMIQGVGPRYCPSIEDKVKRFRDKDRHQIFLEPEGLSTDEIYVNGISTSLPRQVQEDFVRSIVGLENAEFVRYGYAVEYDAVDARELSATLESKDWEGLFFAGQVNGTSGYEEAGAQGLIAGINAGRRALDREPKVFGRGEGYLGVMVDDLVLKGSDEPYRMFTSRAEYRLLLREDNADLRLSQTGYELGVLPRDAYDRFLRKRDAIERVRSEVNAFSVTPNEAAPLLQERGWSPLRERTSGAVLLRRPEVSWKDLSAFGFSVQPAEGFSEEAAEQVEIQIKYDGYIRRDLETLEGLKKQDAMKIPKELQYGSVPGLSAEIVGKLQSTRPETLGQVARIQGVTPAAVATLMIYLKMSEKQGLVPGANARSGE